MNLKLSYGETCLMDFVLYRPSSCATSEVVNCKALLGFMYTIRSAIYSKYI